MNFVAAFPQLHRQVEPALTRQAARIAERQATFVPRPELLAELDERIRQGGLIALEGPPGSGATALLCHLAATRSYAFWFPQDDSGGGLEALCAQLIALSDLPLPLVPPAAGRDSRALEALLAEAGARRPPGDPLVALIGRLPGSAMVAGRLPLPAVVSPGAAVVLACAPGDDLPLQPTQRVRMPSGGAQLERELIAAAGPGCPPKLAAALAARSEGSFLYIRLATGLLATGMLQARTLPQGIEQLHERWWNLLGAGERRLAALLAAARAPLDLALIATLAGLPGDQVRGQLERWGTLLEHAQGQVSIYHPFTRAFVARATGDELASAHAAYGALAHECTGGQLDHLDRQEAPYLADQLALHIALSDAATRATAASLLSSRAWVMMQERRTGSMRAASRDMAWELRMATQDGPTLRLVRGAALAGTLSLLARTLPPDAPAEAFIAAIDRGGMREGMLKRVREMLDQLPDGQNKALALRRLGEVCYALRMRAPAMRMLSEALDLEAPGPPRAWRDEREALLVAFARAAITAGVPNMALGITARIAHAERRGLIETEVVRWLVAREQRARAEEVAYAISHEGMHEWAMAEVAVAHARAGDRARAEEVLGTLKTETAVAWARGELASDAARRGDPHAAEEALGLSSPAARDHALAQVAQALIEGDHPDQALEAARAIESREARAQALIDLGLRRPSQTSAALAYAAAEIVALSGEERVTLIAALAAAQAAAGRLETALRTAALLPAGEERDRAHSRVAAALARHGDHAGARAIALGIQDDDERAWVLGELAHLVAAAHEWETAFELAGQIGNPEERAHAEAELAIAWARAAEPHAAHSRATQIGVPSERLRALTAIAGPLVAAGATQAALVALIQLHDPDARSRYLAALVAALASQGDLAGAERLARAIVRPLERARAFVAIARAAAPHDRALAHQSLGEALQLSARLGRTETFTCLEWAADALAALGGAELLLAAANALDDVEF